MKRKDWWQLLNNWFAVENHNFFRYLHKQPLTLYRLPRLSWTRIPPRTTAWLVRTSCRRARTRAPPSGRSTRARTNAPCWWTCVIQVSGRRVLDNIKSVKQNVNLITYTACRRTIGCIGPSGRHCSQSEGSMAGCHNF